MIGVPSAVLMERAAYASAEEILKALTTDEGVRLHDYSFTGDATRFLIVCGSGNNGGDGIAIARLLFLKGYSVDIYMAGNTDKLSTECRRQLEISNNYGISCVDEIDDCYDCVVDAVFGIGLCREILGAYASVIERLNSLKGFKVAIDIPSGISADTGAVLGVAFKADLTVTFGFGKPGQFLFPGADYCGKVLVKDIGIDSKSMMDIISAKNYWIFIIRSVL